MQNPRKMAEIIWRKKGFGSFILGGDLRSAFNFLKCSLIMCGAFERKAYDIPKFEKK